MGGGSRGVKKEKLRDLSTRALTLDELRALNDVLFNSVAPITVAILGAVLVEHDLERVIRRRLSINNDADWESLLDERGPLGTFHRKIELAYVLKVIDKPTRKNLDIIRAIRNTFAHSKRPITFENPLIVAELEKVQQTPSGKRAFKKLTQFKNQQTKYVVLCWQIAGPLNQRLTRSIMSGTRRKMAKWKKQEPTSNFLSQLFLGGLGAPGVPPLSTQKSRNDDPSPPKFQGLLSSVLNQQKKPEDGRE
jgi:DNA-binding MltR family transcriptional regulator